MIGLDYYDLTLLVINAYAAAMLGRLKSLPLTFAGAMGSASCSPTPSATCPSSGDLAGSGPWSPPCSSSRHHLMPQAQLRVGQVKGIVSAPLPTLRRIGVAGAALVVLWRC